MFMATLVIGINHCCLCSCGYLWLLTLPLILLLPWLPLLPMLPTFTGSCGYMKMPAVFCSEDIFYLVYPRIGGLL